jgi:hypothetical protein
MRNERRIGGPLGASTADGDLDDWASRVGTSRRTAAALVDLIRVGVDIVVIVRQVLRVEVAAAVDLAAEAGGGAVEAALVKQLEVDAARLVLPEAVVERVLEVVEGKVPRAPRVVPVEKGTVSSVADEIVVVIHYNTRHA